MSGLKFRYNNFLRWMVSSRIYDRRLDDLSNRLAVSLNALAGVISIIYVATDILIGAYMLVIPHTFLLLGFIFGVILFRSDKIQLAKVLVLSVYNLSIYVAVQSEPYETASSLYFLLVMIGALVVFEYKALWNAVGFILMSYVLYLASQYTSFNIIPDMQYDESTIVGFFIINVTVFTISVSTVLILYIQMIHIQQKRIKEQNDKLRQTNNELDYFLYSTSHDLRAPLATVLGLINLAQTSTNEEEISSYHNMMKTRVDKMDSFIRDIIDIIRNSRLPVNIEDVNVNEVVSSIIQDLDNPMGFNHVNWKNQIPDGMSIQTDSKRLSTILKNLISNALKYSDPRKEESFVEISGKANGEKYTIEVADNGIGIDKNHLEKIFQMFYRATENSKGAGLGLYIATETTRTLGGSISVESVEGNGAKFELELPVTP